MSTSLEPAVVSPQDGTWVLWSGGPIRYVALGEKTNQGFCASTGTVAPLAGSPPHRHGFHEGFYVLNGEVTFYAGNERVRLGKGDFINVGAGTAHRFANESDVPAEIFTISAPAGFDRFQLEAGGELDRPAGTGRWNGDELSARMREIAPRFNIDLEPPAAAFEEPPRITVRRAGEGRTLAIVGDLYTFLADGDDTDQTYAIWHSIVYPGGGPPPHLHRNEEEAFFILSGEVTFSTGGQDYLGKPGTFVFLPRDGVHTFRNNGGQPAEMLILAAPSGLERMFYEVGKPWSDRSAVPPPPTQAEIEHLLDAAPRFGVEIQPPPAH